MANRTVQLRILIAMAAMLVGATIASGQVVIDMPAPKKPKATQTVHPPVGEVALKRYAAARTEPYDTYGSAATYSSLNTNLYYGYPYGSPFYWGFGFGWPVFVTPVGGGHGHGHHGGGGAGGGHHGGGGWGGGHINLTAPNFGMPAMGH